MQPNCSLVHTYFVLAAAAVAVDAADDFEAYQVYVCASLRKIDVAFSATPSEQLADYLHTGSSRAAAAAATLSCLTVERNSLNTVDSET